MRRFAAMGSIRGAALRVLSAAALLGGGALPAVAGSLGYVRDASGAFTTFDVQGGLFHGTHRVE
jgi:hypothetical protein